jgi:hypothetical protein
MIMLDRLPELERHVEKRKREKAEADGVYKERMNRIRTSFGCKELREAESLLRKQQDEEIAWLRKYNQMWQELLEKEKAKEEPDQELLKILESYAS